MCDDVTVEENEEFFRKAGDMSRRGFGVVTAAMLAACATSPANAKEVAESDVKITTPDGVADCYFVHPAAGKHPAVLIWPDIMGLRPAFRMMAKRLAESGYSVLVVNPYYRKVSGEVFHEGESFADPAVRGRLVPLMQSLTADGTKTDAVTFLKYLDGQKSVDTKKKAGTTGYCMGGPLVVRTAAAVPDRIGAVGSFHGGGLVTKNPDSPHLLIAGTKASYLFCIAENDDKNQPEAKTVLRETCDAAGRPAEIEVYAAQHGWCPPDSAVYNKELAEKAWSRLLATFETALV
jgi:carboxymethylenebutenolidase